MIAGVLKLQCLKNASTNINREREKIKFLLILKRKEGKIYISMIFNERMLRSKIIYRRRIKYLDCDIKLINKIFIYNEKS